MTAHAGDEGVSSSTTAGSSLSSINYQLLTHGWAKRPLNLDALSEHHFNEVVSVLYDLIGAGVTNISTLDNLSARHRTMTYEYERTLKSVNHLRSSQGRLYQEVEGWKARCADMERRMEMEEVKVKELREECSKGRKALDGVRVAASHEAKKMQMKMDKAQGQLLRIGNDSALLSRPQGLVLLNPIPAGRINPTAPSQPPLLEQSIKELAEIRQSLQEETEAFRHVVVSTGNGLREAMALAAGDELPPRLLHSQFFAPVYPEISTRSRASASSTQTFQFASSTSHPSLADARLRSLITQVQAKLADKTPRQVIVTSGGVSSLSEEEVEIQKQVEREQSRERQDLEDRVKDLEVEVTCARAKEQDAKRLAEQFARENAEAVSARVAETDTEADAVNLASDTAREMRQIEKQQKMVAEATARLGQEVKQLEAERNAFLEERRQVDRDAVLALLPPTPQAGIMATTEVTTTLTTSTVSASHAWDMHRPLSPSPLSPHHPRNRTPKPHSAGRRKSAKTPLSRLVLEKAVRQKGRDTAAALTQAGLSVLGDEGGRRTNMSAPSHAPMTAGTGQHPAGSGSGSEGAKSTAKREKVMRTGAGGAGSLGVSTSSALGGSKGPKRDLAKAEGVGPRAVQKGVRAWR